MSEANSKVDPNPTVADVTTGVWMNGRHVVRCARVISETADVKTFCFNAVQPVLFFFKPGQFVTLELEINGQQVMRSYTISSSPSTPYSFSITVKKLPNGQVSGWLHDNLQVGDEIAVHGPVGNFNCIDYPADKVLLLSGGVGITPVMSMARWFFHTNADVDVCFVHSARTPADLLYAHELRGMSNRVPNFHTHLIVENELIGHSWAGYRGYLDRPKLEMIAPDLFEREVFCCGPEPYMDAVKASLTDLGFDMDHYHDESFGATPKEIEREVVEQAEEAEEAELALDPGDMFSVSFSQAGMAVQIAPEQTVHEAAAKLGMHIPKACGMGICGTCKVLKTSGEVRMSHNGGITEEDEQAGYILSCCSVPLSDVVIER